MRFLGSKFTQNALAMAPPRTPLEELKGSPRPLADFRGQGKGKGGERRRNERGKGALGKGKSERRGGKGREEGREGKEKEEGKGGEGELRHWR